MNNVENILRSVKADPAVKDAAWDAYYSATDASSLEAGLRKVNLPPAIKDKLWNDWHTMHPSAQDAAAKPKAKSGMFEDLKSVLSGAGSEISSDPIGAAGDFIKGAGKSLAEGAMWLGDKPYQIGSTLYNLADTGELKWTPPITENEKIKNALTRRSSMEKIGAFAEQTGEMAIGEGALKGGLKAIPILAKNTGKLRALAQLGSGAIPTAAHGGTLLETMMAGAGGVVLGSAGEYLTRYLPKNLVGKLIKANIDPGLNAKRLNPMTAATKANSAIQSILDEGIVAGSVKGFRQKVDLLAGRLYSEASGIVNREAAGGMMLDLNAKIQPTTYLMSNGVTGGVLPGLEAVLPKGQSIGLIDAIDTYIKQVLPQELKKASVGLEKKAMQEGKVLANKEIDEAHKTIFNRIAGEWGKDEAGKDVLVSPGIIQELTHMYNVTSPQRGVYNLGRQALPTTPTGGVLAHVDDIFAYKRIIGDLGYNTFGSSPEMNILTNFYRHLYRALDNVSDMAHPSMKGLNDRIAGLVEASAALRKEETAGSLSVVRRHAEDLLANLTFGRIIKSSLRHAGAPALATYFGGPALGIGVGAVQAGLRSTPVRSGVAYAGHQIGKRAAAAAAKYPAAAAILRASRYPILASIREDDPLGYNEGR